MRTIALFIGIIVFGGCVAEPANVQNTAVNDSSVAPGVNTAFKSDDVNVSMWADRFEGESREVFTARLSVLDALALEPGVDIADIGAGTGLYVQLFAEAVSASGTVYANDISQPFLDFIAENAAKDGLTNVKTVLGGDRSSNLPVASVDVIFHSDVYHHFEFPADMNADLFRALRPGGRLYVLDFERIEGVSDQRRLDHVRAPKETVIAEIEAAGFEFVGEIELDELQENYLISFVKSTTQ